MSKKALLIGIDYFTNPTINLSGCINDIVNMRSMLIDAYNYSPSNITMLRDDSTNPAVQPTYKNILMNLKSLASQSVNLSEIWIHYSGHGSHMDDNITDNLLVPVDYESAGYIMDVDLLAIVRTIKCRCILLFDSCNSGTICNLQWTFNYISPTQYNRTMINNITIQNPNIFVFSGCRDNQTSADVTDCSGNSHYGAFTNAFLESLRKNMHNVPMLTLYRDVCMYLSNQGLSQIPVFSATNHMPTAVFIKSGPTTITSNQTTQTPTLTPTQTIKSNMKSVIGL